MIISGAKMLTQHAQQSRTAAMLILFIYLNWVNKTHKKRDNFVKTHLIKF